MLAVLQISLQFTMMRSGMNDPDIWWHLRNAEYLFQHHEIPRADMYSFTVSGQPWINHEWLAEIPYYLAWRASGLGGLKAASIVTVQLIFLGVLYLCYKESRNFKASVAACCFSSLLASVSFGPRTILFGYAYLVILLIVLHRFRQRGTAPLWLIPPLFCLWINTHGSWSLGLILFAIVVAAGLVKGTWGRIEAQKWTPSQLRKLLVTGTASVAALFVNPFGYRLVLYPFDLAFRQKLNIAHVAEWVSVDFHTTRGKVMLLLIFFLLLSTLWRSRTWNLAELGLLLFGLYSGLTYIRFLFLFSIVLAPVLAKTLDFMPSYRPDGDTPWFNALVIFLMIAGMLHYWPTRAEVQQSVGQDYPAQLLPFLKTHPLNGPMLNFYLWGGYLGWNERELKVFVDSRVDIFEYAGVLQDYLDLLGLQRMEPVFNNYHIRYVLFPLNEPLAIFLEHDPNWRVSYKDNLCVLLEKEKFGVAGLP